MLNSEVRPDYYFIFLGTQARLFIFKFLAARIFISKNCQPPPPPPPPESNGRPLSTYCAKREYYMWGHTKLISRARVAQWDR